MAYEIRRNRPIFSEEIYEANLEVKVLFGEITHLLDPKIRKIQ